MHNCVYAHRNTFIIFALYYFKGELRIWRGNIGNDPELRNYYNRITCLNSIKKNK